MPAIGTGGGPGSVSPSTPATASTTCCCLYRGDDDVTEEAACVLIRKAWQPRRYALAPSSHLTGISHVLEMGYTVYMHGTPDSQASADRFKKDRRRACVPALRRRRRRRRMVQANVEPYRHI